MFSPNHSRLSAFGIQRGCGRPRDKTTTPSAGVDHNFLGMLPTTTSCLAIPALKRDRLVYHRLMSIMKPQRRLSTEPLSLSGFAKDVERLHVPGWNPILGIPRVGDNGMCLSSSSSPRDQTKLIRRGWSIAASCPMVSNAEMGRNITTPRMVFRWKHLSLWITQKHLCFCSCLLLVAAPGSATCTRLLLLLPVYGC